MLPFGLTDIIFQKAKTMKITFTPLLCAAPVLGLALFGCKSAEAPDTQTQAAVEKVESVVKPIPGLEIAPKTYEIDASQASTIELPNGGSIEIPAHSFVDEQGNPVERKVNIEWQEFHSLTDIALSGIPMKYDSAGVSHDLVSGGMFSIHGNSEGKAIEFAENKSATVNLASIQDTPCFNFYELDEKTGAWDYQTTKGSTPIPGAPIAATNEESKKKKEDAKATIFDVQVNTADFPELKGQQIVGWKCTQKVANKKILNSRISTTKLLAGKTPGTYELSITLDKVEKSYTVTPYLLSEAMKDTKKNSVKLERDLSELVEFQNNVASGKVIRSIQISNFGVYNWDKINSNPNAVGFIAHFDLPNDVNPKLVSMFLVCPEQNLIVKYDPSVYNQGGKMTYDPTVKNCLIAILPDNTLAAVGNEGFKSIAKGSEHTFVLKKTDIVINSGSDLAAQLKELI